MNTTFFFESLFSLLSSAMLGLITAAILAFVATCIFTLYQFFKERFLKRNRDQIKQDKLARTVEVKNPKPIGVLNCMMLKFWEIEYHIPMHWDNDMAIFQSTLFFNAVKEGYVRQDTPEGYRRAGILQNFVDAIPVHLPQAFERFKMECGVLGAEVKMEVTKVH
jgi:hypothetical protein